MTGLAGPLAALFLASVFSPTGFSEELRRTLERGGHLPAELGPGTVSSVPARFHFRSRWNDAFYVPRRDGGPLLWLSGERYLAGLGLADLRSLPVDLAEELFFSLAAAEIDAILEEGGITALQIVERARFSMDEAPEDRQIEAYVNAGASFVSHVLSIANEIERSAIRRPGSAARLCPKRDVPIPLYDLWERAFRSTPFPGSWSSGDEIDSPLRYTRAVLRTEDKELFVGLLLGDRWIGERIRDFGARYCPFEGLGEVDSGEDAEGRPLERSPSDPDRATERRDGASEGV